MAAKKGSAKKKPVKKDKAAEELAAAKNTIKKLRVTVEKLEKKLAKAETKAADLKSQAKKVAKPAKTAVTEVPVTSASSADTRTVAQLRAAAKAKGVVGYSRLRKDQLIAAL